MNSRSQRGAALLMVLVVIISLSLLLPAGFSQVALSYDIVAKELEKQRAELMLDSVLMYRDRVGGCDSQLAFTVDSDLSGQRQPNDSSGYLGMVTCQTATAGLVLNGSIALQQGRVSLSSSRVASP